MFDKNPRAVGPLGPGAECAEFVQHGMGPCEVAAEPGAKRARMERLVVGLRGEEWLRMVHGYCTWFLSMISMLVN